MGEPAFIARNFGTARGGVRLALSYAQNLLPNARKRPANNGAVRRLVFVCHGNICRSAFAEWAARAQDLNTASLGLSTSTGKAAHPPVMEYAASIGLNMDAHLTTAVEDFTPAEGDFFLAMEFRHLDKLARNAALQSYPRDLLGNYHTPPIPHLHDPYRLDPAYLPVCLERTRRAVEHLPAIFPGARIV